MSLTRYVLFAILAVGVLAFIPGCGKKDLDGPDPETQKPVDPPKIEFQQGAPPDPTAAPATTTGK